MTTVIGVPADAVAAMRETPFWAAMEPLAHQPVRDAALLGDFTVPAERLASVTVPTLVPDREHDGTATWSLTTLERAARGEGLPWSGATTIRRVRRAAGRSSQRTRTWCPTGPAVRQRKEEPVRVSDPETEKKRGASRRRSG